VEVARRRGRRHKKLLDDLKDERGYSHLKEEALIALCGETVLEEAFDLSSDRILNEMTPLLLYGITVLVVFILKPLIYMYTC
jgi:hypothetical protein